MDYRRDIPIGRERAVTRSELARRWGKSERTVREIVQRLRNEPGLPILSDAKGMGYYRTNDPVELADHLRRETARAARILQTLATVQAGIENPVEFCRLRALREAKGMSQSAFVKAMAEHWPQLDRVALSKVECGHVVLHPHALRHAARILGVMPWDIYPSLLIDCADVWEGC